VIRKNLARFSPKKEQKHLGPRFQRNTNNVVGVLHTTDSHSVRAQPFHAFFQRNSTEMAKILEGSNFQRHHLLLGSLCERQLPHNPSKQTDLVSASFNTDTK
jgi:hypothetical protein